MKGPVTTVLTSAGVGAGLMYLLDPQEGARRRALVRDQVVRFLNKAGDAAGATARDVRHRAKGVVAEARGRFTEGEVDDEVLVQRVRSRLGRVVSHPRAVDVTADQGRVTLSGPILTRDEEHLLTDVRRVRGVKEVENRLERHESADGIPALQGGVQRTGERSALMQQVWSPTTRMLVGTAGSALTLYGASHRTAPGALLGVAGFGLLARAVTNLDTQRLLGIGAGRRAVDIQNSITINAPVDTVYDFWTGYENFPGFMANVQRVEDLGGGRSRWTVRGPAGSDVSFEATVTRREPNRVLAWKTRPGAAVAHAGEVRFEANPDGTTTAHVRFSYNPPAGAVGHAVAWLFASDPKREMDEDLMRMKHVIEGRTRVHVERPPRASAP